jgi:hypothetical protein
VVEAGKGEENSAMSNGEFWRGRLRLITSHCFLGREGSGIRMFRDTKDGGMTVHQKLDGET